MQPFVQHRRRGERPAGSTAYLVFIRKRPSWPFPGLEPEHTNFRVISRFPHFQRLAVIENADASLHRTWCPSFPTGTIYAGRPSRRVDYRRFDRRMASPPRRACRIRGSASAERRIRSDWPLLIIPWRRRVPRTTGQFAARSPPSPPPPALVPDGAAGLARALSRSGAAGVESAPRHDGMLRV